MMSRAVKFRTWDGKTMETLTLEDLAFSIREDERQIPEASDWHWADLPVMQYTGLEDKNGKEIYEGDIVTDHYLEISAVVRYGVNGWGCFALDTAGSISDLMVCADSQVKHEVIGNVFENPDLLTEDTA